MKSFQTLSKKANANKVLRRKVCQASRRLVIKKVIVTPIAPNAPTLLNTVALRVSFVLRTILEIITENNVFGISEIPEIQVRIKR